MTICWFPSSATASPTPQEQPATNDQGHFDPSSCVCDPTTPDIWEVLDVFPAGTEPPPPDPGLEASILASPAGVENADAAGDLNLDLYGAGGIQNLEGVSVAPRNPLCTCARRFEQDGVQPGIIRLKPHWPRNENYVYWFVNKVTTGAIVTAWTKPFVKDSTPERRPIPDPTRAWDKKTIANGGQLSQCWFQGLVWVMFDINLRPEKATKVDASIFKTVAFRPPVSDQYKTCRDIPQGGQLTPT